jgi:hypothetical protein
MDMAWLVKLFLKIAYNLYNNEYGFFSEDMANCTRDGNAFCTKKFDNLFNSLFTMLQVLTGESWMEAIGFLIFNILGRYLYILKFKRSK